MNDESLARQIGAFVKHHRIRQNKTQAELALSAGISRSTLSLLERGEPVMLPSLIQVLRMLNQLHVMEVFVVEEAVSPLLLAKLQQRKRKRVRHQAANTVTIQKESDTSTD